MLSEAKSFWDAIAGKVRELIRGETQNTFRMERYDVTTAPNGSRIGVTKPFGTNEIFLPYSNEVAFATVGQPVLVAWWGSMSNAKVYYFADGYRSNLMTYQILNSVTKLGQTSGSATIAGVWAALPASSVIICDASQFASNQTPNPYGMVEVLKYSVSRGYINFYGETESNADYRMYFTNENTPTGTWVKEPGRIPDCFTLLNAASVRAGTVSTYANREITDYQLLVAEWVVDNAVRATVTTWRELFQSANYVSLSYVDSINTQRYCEIVYMSATSVTVRCSQNADGHIYLYGIKNN